MSEPSAADTEVTSSDQPATSSSPAHGEPVVEDSTAVADAAADESAQFSTDLSTLSAPSAEAADESAAMEEEETAAEAEPTADEDQPQQEEGETNEARVEAGTGESTSYESFEDFSPALQTALTEVLTEPEAEKFGVKEVMRRLAIQFGADLCKTYRAQIKDSIRETAKEMMEQQKRAAAEAEQEAAAEGVDQSYLDAEGSDEEEIPAPKSKKRLRKAAEADEEEDLNEQLEESYEPEESGNDENYSDADEYRASGSSARKSKKSTSSSARGGGGGRKKKSTSKDLVKRPATSYTIFLREIRSELQVENPGAALPELSRLMAQRWRSLSDPERMEFEEKAREDKARFHREIEELRKTNPSAAAELLSKSRKKKGEDDDTASAKKKSKKKKTDPGVAEESQNDEDSADKPAAPLNYFDSIVAGMKNKRQTKSELSEEDTRKLDNLFMAKMKKAALADDQAQKAGRPAVEKIKMLDEVVTQVSKKHVADRLVQDNSLLAVFNEWLQLGPAPEYYLPNIKLRSTIYKLLEGLSVSEQALENSGGLGKTLMSMWKHSSETHENKTLLSRMLERWMRPMLKIDSHYRNLARHEETKFSEITSRAAILGSKKQMPQIGTSRARIPEAAPMDFAIRPQSGGIDRDEEGEEDAPVKGPETQKQKMMKRLEKARKSAAADTGRARHKVDVSGGRTNLT